MPEIFLSYRTNDSFHSAPLIWERLKTVFGEEKMFLDTASTRAGDDFEEKVWPALRASKVMIVVIGPDWLTGGYAAHRRIDDPDDYVRREVRTALQSEGIRILPVTIKGVKLEKLDLPEDIRKLRDKVGIPFDHRYFERDLAVLVERVKEWVQPLKQHGRLSTDKPSKAQVVYASGDIRGNIIANGPVSSGDSIHMGGADDD